MYWQSERYPHVLTSLRPAPKVKASHPTLFHPIWIFAFEIIRERTFLLDFCSIYSLLFSIGLKSNVFRLWLPIDSTCILLLRGWRWWSELPHHQPLIKEPYKPSFDWLFFPFISNREFVKILLFPFYSKEKIQIPSVRVGWIIISQSSLRSDELRLLLRHYFAERCRIRDVHSP